MKGTPFEPIVRDAAIKAIDGISKRVAEAEARGGGALGKLMRKWNSLDLQEKEQFIAMAITIGTAAAAAFSAMRARRSQKKAKNALKKIAKKVTG
jgi:hypothetical protein